MMLPSMHRILEVKAINGETHMTVEGFDQPVIFGEGYAHFVEPGHTLVSCPEYQEETFGNPFFIILSTPEEFRAKLENIRRDAH